jgi:hypothetical protein
MSRVEAASRPKSASITEPHDPQRAQVYYAQAAGPLVCPLLLPASLLTPDHAKAVAKSHTFVDLRPRAKTMDVPLSRSLNNLSLSGPPMPDPGVDAVDSDPRSRSLSTSTPQLAHLQSHPDPNGRHAHAHERRRDREEFLDRVTLAPRQPGVTRQHDAHTRAHRDGPRSRERYQAMPSQVCACVRECCLLGKADYCSPSSLSSLFVQAPQAPMPYPYAGGPGGRAVRLEQVPQISGEPRQRTRHHTGGTLIWDF